MSLEYNMHVLNKTSDTYYSGKYYNRSKAKKIYSQTIMQLHEDPTVKEPNTAILT